MKGTQGYELKGHQLLVNGEPQPVDQRTVRIALRLYPVETGRPAPEIAPGKFVRITEDFFRFLMSLESRFSTETLAAAIARALLAA